MAKEKAKETAKAAVAKEVKKGAKPAITEDAAKLAKREARKEALKNRPDGQRPNSKQIDIIDLGKSGKVEVYGASVRKTGTLATAIAFDEKGNIISVSLTLVPGVKVKAKKGHGALQPGVAGEGKKKKGEESESDDEDED